MRKHADIKVQLSEDETTATVFVSGRRDPIVAGCLGIDRDRHGRKTRIYLNALIHPVFEAQSYRAWIPTGAISTILTRTDDDRGKP